MRFPSPDRAARTEIWRRHLPDALPLDGDVRPEQLAEVDDVTGRDICRAVIDAVAEVLRPGRPAGLTGGGRGSAGTRRLRSSRPGQ
ncbi:hypothetical protein ACH4TX_05980 [Streptomyces sp. NPDC021098]|uniref:hypothetical protein n=1 Tax=unclassified Streptomyces TaxID=2593676 RepID=UPI0037BDF1CC